MINFNELKQKRIRREFEYEGEIITVLNPVGEIKEKLKKMINKSTETDGDLAIIDVSLAENIENMKEIFETLIEGVDFPKDIKEFENIINEPSLLIKQIQFEIDQIIREIGMENILELKNQITYVSDMAIYNEVYKSMKDIVEKKNIDIPEILLKDNKDKKQDIVPKEKAKPKRKKKSTKKDEKVVDIKEVADKEENKNELKESEK